MIYITVYIEKDSLDMVAYLKLSKQLALDDAENGDLIHTSEDKDSLSEGTKNCMI